MRSLPAQSRRLLLVAALAVVAAAVAFFFIGRASADAEGEFDHGFARGQSLVLAEYRRGRPRYEAIYDAGFADGKIEGRREGVAAGTRAGESEGEAEGERAGLEEGQRQGRAAGTRAGAAAALGGFTGWTPDGLYVVKLAAGTQPEVPFTVASRLQMQQGIVYDLCADDPAQLCERPR